MISKVWNRWQSGQGMTEYIVITGMVAIAAIGVYQLLGSSVRLQTAVSASELAGNHAAASKAVSALDGVANQAVSLANSAASMANLSAVSTGRGVATANNATNHTEGTSNSSVHGQSVLASGGNSSANGSANNASNATSTFAYPVNGNTNVINSSASNTSHNSSFLNSLLNTLQSGSDYMSSLNIGAPGVLDGKELGASQCEMKAGNPINIATGLKYQREVDYQAPSGLSFTRHYNSKGANPGWQHNWQKRVQGDATSNVARVTRADGKTYTFKFKNNVWHSDADVNDSLLRKLDAQQQLQGWVYYTAAHVAEHFNAQGQLVAIVDRAGQVLTLTYSDGSPLGERGGLVLGTTNALPAGLLLKITDPYQRSITLAYDVAGRMVQMSDPAGGVYRYAYDVNQNLQRVVYPDASSKIYHYEDERFKHALTGITDENGQRFATWRYDQRGRAVSSEHGIGVEKVQVSYKGNGESAVTDALGRTHTRRFQEVLGVKHSIGVDQPGGAGCDAASSELEYDDNGNVSSSTDFNGNKVCLAYDRKRNLELYRLEGVAPGKDCPSNLADYVPKAASVERKISTQWHRHWRLPVLVAEPLRRTSFEYSDAGLPQTISMVATNDENGGAGFKAQQVGVARTSHYRYNASGLLTEVDGPRTDVADVSAYVYDAQGNLIQVRNALGHVALLTDYDAHGHAGTLITPNQQTIRFKYDSRGRLVSSGRTRYQYDAAGNLLQIGLSSGAAYRFAYDAAHRLNKITDQAGNSIDYTLDGLGNHVKEQTRNAANELVKTHRREFDGLNRLWKDIGALNQTRVFEYDNNGNVTKVSAAQSLQAVHQYDALNRVVSSLDANNHATRYVYDQQNQLTQVIDPRNLLTAYQPDAFGNVGKMTSPDAGYSDASYDSAGNMVTRISANQQRASYRYDVLNRLQSIRYPDNSEHSYQYDEGRYGIGRLTGIRDNTGSVQYSYNEYGWLASETHQRYGASYRTSYGYDAVGRLTSISYPSGRKISYQLDAQGRVQQISASMGKRNEVLISQVRYFPFGGVQSFSYGDGAQVYRRDFDLDGRISRYTLNGQTQHIAYDELSRIRRISDEQGQGVRYEYDALNRIQAYSVNNGHEYRFEYDNNGNRTRQIIAGMAVNYQYSANNNRMQTMQVGSARVEQAGYAENGATQYDAVRQNRYRYDARGRMVQAITRQGVVNFALDALGQRVRKQSSSGDTLYHYDANGHLLAESTTGGKGFGNEYIYLGDMLVGVLAAGNRYYVHTDHLNTPRVITDTRGKVVWQWQNVDPFGNNKPNIEHITFNPRFAGQYADSETGLYYNRFRNYDPVAGRYVESDPIGLRGGLNTYAYVSNKPLSYTDSSGLIIDTIWDVGNVVYDLATGQWGDAALDAVSMCIPGVPAGITKLRKLKKLGKAGEEVAEEAVEHVDELVDLASAKRRQHILDGDRTGGGHRPGMGFPGKSEFPAGWSDDKIMHAISDIATDPTLTNVPSRGGRMIVEGTRDGVNIKVVLESNGDIVSGFPTNVPRNPK